MSTNITSTVTLASLEALASSSLVAGQVNGIANYALNGDEGGGLFTWNVKDVGWADGGIHVIPTDRTASVSGVTLAVTDGTTKSWSGTFATYATGATTVTTDGAGTGAALTISTVSSGQVTGIAISAAGTGYAVGDYLFIAQGSVQGAVAQVNAINVATGAITATVILVEVGYILPATLIVTAGSLTLKDAGCATVTSNPALATTTASAAIGTNTMVVASTTGIVVGQIVAGVGLPYTLNSWNTSIPSGVTVTAISGSQSTVYGQTGYVLTLSQTVEMPIQNVTMRFFAPVTFTVNYLTGAWTLTYNIAPASGTTITASYSYAKEAGRWLRQYSGGLNICWYGANANTGGTGAGTDIWPAWVRADYYAFLTGAAVYIPTPARTASYRWVLSTPMTVLARRTSGDIAMGGTNSVTALNCQGFSSSLPDLTAAVTLVNPFVFENIGLTPGPDPMPSPSTLVSSGWIPAQAVFQGTITGSTLTVISMTSGYLCVGHAISGAGMAPCPIGNCKISAQLTGTPGGAGTYTITMPAGIKQNTIGTAITITATWMPWYSGFGPGRVGFLALNQGRFLNCSASSFKAGFWMNAIGGHTTVRDCALGGLFGVMAIGGDTQDYSFWDCDITGGVFASVATGNNGMAATYWRCHVGFAPYCFFQFTDSATLPAALYTRFFGTSWEGYGEAAWFSCGIPSVGGGGAQIFISGVVGGGPYTIFSLPTTLVPVPISYVWQFCGIGVYEFECSYGSFTGGTNTVALAYIAQLTNNQLSTDAGRDAYGKPYEDLDVFDGSIVYGTIPISQPYDIRKPRYDRDFIRRSELTMLPAFATQGNLIHNPEVASNWTSGSAGTTIAITPLSTLLAGALSGWATPREIYEECGANPNVIVIANTSSTPKATITLNGLLTPGTTRALGLNTWFATGTAFGSVGLTSPSNTPIAEPFTSAISTGNGFIRAKTLGCTLQDAGFSTIAYFQAAGTTANSTIYLIGPMITQDNYASYNPYAGPLAMQPLGGQSYALSGLPSATLFPLGATTFCTNGRNSGEGAGAGTGCPVFVKSVSGTPTWCAVWSGVAVTS